MATDTQFVASIHQLLENTLLPDTNTVKAATEGLQSQYKNPAIVPALFQILASPTDNGVRQLAGVELRKRLAKSAKAWNNQSVEVRAALKAKLLEIVKDEPNNSVRNTSARVVCEIARRELSQNAWPELLPFLFTAAEQGNANQRQASVFVFFTLLETFNDEESVQGYLPQIMQLFSKTLNDPESLSVRVTTVRGLGKVGDLLEPDAEADLAAIQSAIPQMVQVLEQAFESADSEGVKHILDVFDTFCLSDAPILNNFLGDLMAFYLRTAAREDLEDELREAALNSTIWSINYKRQKIQQLGLARIMIPHILAIIPTGDFDDDDESNPATIALRLLDTMATELPPSHVWPALLEQLKAFAQNSDPAYRAAGLLALGISCEGLSETLRPQMDLVWQFVGVGLEDGEPRVRRAAAMCIAYLCDQLGDEIVKQHKVIMPALMHMIGNSETQRDATRALDRFLENLGEEIKLYLQPVMETLAGYIDTVPLDIKKSIIAAIGSAAHASKRDFLPYFDGVMTKLMPFLQLKDTKSNEEMDFRAITQDTVGTFSDAVGPEAFRPYFATTMTIAYDAFALDQPRLRECSFIFFSTMAKVFGEEFSQFLPQIGPKMLESLRQPEHEPVGGTSGDGLTGTAVAAQGDDDEDEFIDFEDLNGLFGSFSSAIAIEKEVAADAVGEVFKHTKSGFLPYLQESVQDLVGLLQHYSSSIRKSALQSLFTCIQTLDSIQDTGAWKPGLSVPVPISNDVEQLIDVVMTNLFIMWEDEDDKFVATALCDSLTETLKEVGPAVIAKRTSDVADIAMSILEKKSVAQNPDADEDETDEDSSEYENLLVASAMDLVGAMADALGPDFQQPLQSFLPQIVKYYGPGKAVAERQAVTSTIGVLAGGMKEHITPFTTSLLTILSHAVTDEDMGVRTNATFSSGLLVGNSSENLAQHYPALLTALQPALSLPADASQPQEAKALKDNAVGCLARMVRKNPDALPLDQTFPLIFSGLPLLYDNAEWDPVVQLTIALVQSNNAMAQTHIDDILRMYAHVLAHAGDEDDWLSPEVRGHLVTFISHLNTQVPDKVQSAGLSSFLV